MAVSDDGGALHFAQTKALLVEEATAFHDIEREQHRARLQLLTQLDRDASAALNKWSGPTVEQYFLLDFRRQVGEDLQDITEETPTLVPRETLALSRDEERLLRGHAALEAQRVTTSRKQQGGGAQQRPRQKKWADRKVEEKQLLEDVKAKDALRKVLETEWGVVDAERQNRLATLRQEFAVAELAWAGAEGKDEIVHALRVKGELEDAIAQLVEQQQRDQVDREARLQQDDVRMDEQALRVLRGWQAIRKARKSQPATSAADSRPSTRYQPPSETLGLANRRPQPIQIPETRGGLLSVSPSSDPKVPGPEPPPSPSAGAFVRGVLGATTPAKSPTAPGPKRPEGRSPRNAGRIIAAATTTPPTKARSPTAQANDKELLARAQQKEVGQIRLKETWAAADEAGGQELSALKRKHARLVRKQLGVKEEEDEGDAGAPLPVGPEEVAYEVHTTWQQIQDLEAKRTAELELRRERLQQDDVTLTEEERRVLRGWRALRQRRGQPAGPKRTKPPKSSAGEHPPVNPEVLKWEEGGGMSPPASRGGKRRHRRRSNPAEGRPRKDSDVPLTTEPLLSPDPSPVASSGESDDSGDAYPMEPVPIEWFFDAAEEEAQARLPFIGETSCASQLGELEECDEADSSGGRPRTSSPVISKTGRVGAVVEESSSEDEDEQCGESLFIGEVEQSSFSLNPKDFDAVWNRETSTQLAIEPASPQKSPRKPQPPHLPISAAGLSPRALNKDTPPMTPDPSMAHHRGRRRQRAQSRRLPSVSGSSSGGSRSPSSVRLSLPYRPESVRSLPPSPSTMPQPRFLPFPPSPSSRCSSSASSGSTSPAVRPRSLSLDPFPDDQTRVQQAGVRARSPTTFASAMPPAANHPVTKVESIYDTYRLGGLHACRSILELAASPANNIPQRRSPSSSLLKSNSSRHRRQRP